MPATEGSRLTALSNTGPLISIFQSDSLEVITTLFECLYTSPGCVAELAAHGWEERLSQAGPAIVVHSLTDTEIEQAREIAQQIAGHHASNEPLSDKHFGEAEVMVLAQRSEFAGGIILLDELAARSIARKLKLELSGFAGVLLLAVSEGLLTAEEVKERLDQCRQQGTHYGAPFIEQIYRAAQKSEKRDG
jgi:predicted nucleic acid-binding protein